MKTSPPSIVLNNGRTSVPPSLAISLLLLRAVEGVSLAEAIERSQ